MPLIIPGDTVNTNPDRDTLRDRIAEALRPGSRDRSGQYPEGLMRDVEAVLAVLPDQTACICGHAGQQHFEDACLACDCGDYLEPAAAREVIARWRDAAMQARADRAAILTEAADGLLRLCDTLITEPGVTGKYLAGIERSAEELRRLAAEAQREPDTETPTAADVQLMLARMRASASARALGHLLRLIADWYRSSEGRDVLVDDLIAAGYRLPEGDEPAAEALTTTKPSCPDPIECSHEAALGQAREEIRRLGLMVDEYGAEASALTDKLKRVRDLHRETCIVARAKVQPGAFVCGMCVVLDAPALPLTGPAAGVGQDGAQPSCPAKHGALGRICELPPGHSGMHTGSGPNGGAVWDGDAP